MLQVSAPHKSVIVPLRPDIASLFPDLRPIDAAWGALTHDPSTTVMLRNLGLEVPSPVLHHYNWPHPPHKPPFDVQKETVCLLTENARAYVLSGMGVGKTACPIWAFDYLKGLGLATKMLVVAPLSTLSHTWLREIFDFCPHLRATVLYGTKEKRLDQLARTDVDIYVINHDGVKTIYPALAARKDIDTLCLDELAVYRNGNDRSKLMQKYAQGMKWVWGMTGSPAPNAPTDVWGQCRIVTPNTVPKFFTRFREHLMVKINAFKWVPRNDAMINAYKVMQPSARFALEDVTELPAFISRTVDFDLGAQQEQIYKNIKNHCFSLLGNQSITAVNAGAALNKLLQISLGWVYTNDGRVVKLDNDNRVNALLDIIDACENKVIVFSAFKHALAGLEAEMKADGIDVVSVSGDTPAGKRNEIFNAFQNTPKYRVLNAHPQCLAHGLTLTAADTIVWFGPITSLDIYDQANARIRRVGQKKKQQFIHIQGTPTEKKIYRLLIGKQDVQTQLLDLFRE